MVVGIGTGGASAAFIFMFVAALATAGWMSAWQARNHEHHLEDRRRDEEKIARLAYEDTLTGLPNRAELERRLGESIADGQPIALLAVDIDGFKVVNDSLGHTAGDTILCQVARRLERATAGAGLLARHGGDEFAVLATDLGDDAQTAATALAERMLSIVRLPLEADGTEFELDAGVGIAAATPTTASTPRTCCATPRRPCTARRHRATARSASGRPTATIPTSGCR